MNLASIRPIKLGFRIAIVASILMLTSALVAIYLKFNDFLVGNIRIDSTAQILTKINAANLESANKQLRARQQTPYAASDLRNPFNPLPLPPPRP